MSESTHAAPLLSVCMITYKHEPFIRQSIESVIEQDTDFEFVLLINDDCSPDNTPEVVARVMAEHPKGYRIRYHRYEQNVGMVRNFFHQIESVTTKYVAMCEGDDYWADSKKLQKQVNWLEAHPETVLTCHDAIDVNEHGAPLATQRLREDQRRDYSAQEMREGAYVLTLTMCFRKVIERFPEEVFDVYNGDLFLTILLGEHGNCHFMPDITPACYRLHQAGVWSLKSKAFRFQKASGSYLTIARYFKRLGEQKLQRHYLRWFYERNEEVLKLMEEDGAAAEGHDYLKKTLASLKKEDEFNFRIAAQRYQRILFARHPIGKFLLRVKKFIRG